MDYDDLAVHVARHRTRPAIVVATCGTPLTEAVDDLAAITAVLDTAGVPGRYLHVDAAHAGIPTALRDPADRPRFDFADGADSISLDGHPFVGSPSPTGIVVVKTRRRRRALTLLHAATSEASTGRRQDYGALLWWHALSSYGVDGLREHVDQARALAEYTRQRLTDIGWEAWRNPHAMTVMFKTSLAQNLPTWAMPISAGWSHIVCLPGTTRTHIDELLSELIEATAPTSGPATAHGRLAPRCRPPAEAAPS